MTTKNRKENIMKKIIALITLIFMLFLTSCSLAPTVEIGENGNWWINGEDTGKPAKGDTGDKGEQGAQGIQGAQGAQGAQGDKGDTGDKGDKGDTGVSIVSIEKTSTSGLVDTYTVFFSNNTTTTFTVTNGDDGSSVTVESVTNVSSKDNVDTYEIKFSDNTTTRFTVTNGKNGTSVESVTKVSTKDSVDTYEIKYSDNTTTTFTVTNGKDGTSVTVKSVNKVSTKGNVDTYEIKFSDGTSTTFTVTNGEDGTSVTVKSVTKVSTKGNVDTYEMKFSDGTSTTFTVTNGSTPYVGENGNWWINGEDTGVGAVEKNMDRVGTDGLLFRTTIRGGVAGYEVFGYTGTATDIVIPNYIFDQPVVSIAQGALPTSMTSLSISSNTEYLTDLEDYTKLTSFDFNNAPVNTLPVDMFRDCSALKEIKNYSNIEVVSSYAFYGTDIRAFDFSKITTIGSYAFRDCTLFDEWAVLNAKWFLYVPSNVTAIAQYAFPSDLPVYYAGDTPEFTSNYLFTNVKVTSDGYYYTVDGSNATLLNYDGTGTRLVIPKSVDGKTVTALSRYAFTGNPKLERVEIPSTVKTMGAYCFSICKNLHSLFIPDSLESIGAFDDFCENQSYGFESTTVFFKATSFDLTGGITAPSQLGLVKYMTGISPSDISDDDNFVYLKKTLSYEIVTIKNVAGAVTVPATYNLLPVSKINTYALYGNTLTTVVNISSGIDKIATKAFYNSSNLKIVNVPKSVNIVNYQGFYNLSYTSVYIAADAIPTDWDSSWYYSISGYKVASVAAYSTDGAYFYETVDGRVYLIKYLRTMTTKTPIVIPDKIDGKTVYGIRSNCYEASTSPNSSNRYIFVIPSTISVMESYAIYIPYYGYSDLYMYVSSSSDIPTGWNSSWFYSGYGYRYNSGYNNVYYKGQWEYKDKVPTLKS